MQETRRNKVGGSCCTTSHKRCVEPALPLTRRWRFETVAIEPPCRFIISVVFVVVLLTDWHWVIQSERHIENSSRSTHINAPRHDCHDQEGVCAHDLLVTFQTGLLARAVPDQHVHIVFPGNGRQPPRLFSTPLLLMYLTVA